MSELGLAGELPPAARTVDDLPRPLAAPELVALAPVRDEAV
jgi:hypothetical protein